MKKTFCIILAVCMMAALLAGCGSNNKEQVPEASTAETATAFEPAAEENKEYADIVVYGTIFTAENEENETVEAFAVKDGKYICVGSKDDVTPFIKDGETEIIDRTGEGLIIPGCTEGHSHYFGIYGVQSQLPCANCSYEEMLDVLKEQVASGNITQFGTFGWNGAELRDRKAAGYNFAEELEGIAPGIPVVLIDNTGHNAVCNMTALIRSGLWEHPELRGGEVCLDKDGKPSGYVSDQAVGFVFENTIDDLLTVEQFQKACETAQSMLVSMGYTNAFDAYLNQFAETSVFEAIKALDDKGELKMNVAASYNIKSCDADIYREKVDRAAAIAEANESEHFAPGYMKLFADGVTEEGTGWLFNEYSSAPEGKEHGNVIWEPEELKDIVTYANSKGMLVHTHSYGDAACNAVLDAYIASNEENGGEYRNCLGHVRNIKQEDIIRAAENKVPVAANLIWHADYDDNDPKQLESKNHLINLMSEDIYYSGYPMKSLTDSGVIVSSSTDAPAAMTIEGTAMNVLEVAVTGITPGDSAQPFAEEELLTIEEGLKALTINGAWQLGLEEERGSIKEGKYADFAILDKNILDYGKDQYDRIGDTKVLSTYFEGREVFSAQERVPGTESGQQEEAFYIDELTCLIDLHLHADGALSPENVRELAALQNIEIPESEEELLDLLRVSDDCKDLNEFLEKFAFPCSLLKTYDGAKTAFSNLARELKDQGVMYAELRIAPQKCTSEGFDQEAVVQACIEGMNSIEGIKCQLILCCMRGADKKLNIESIDVAKKYLGKGVCAADLAGAEGLFPTEDYADIFEYANKIGVPFVIHAGEAAGPDSVRCAINFGAKRIGHGIRSIEDMELVKMLAEKQIPLEYCPTSNVKTGLFNSIGEEPFEQLKNAGVYLTINTDDPSVEGTTIKEEYKSMVKYFSLTKQDIKQLLINAVNASFADDATKTEMLNKVKMELE